MTKENKFEVVEQLTAEIKNNPSFYVLDIGGMSVKANNDLRRAFFHKGYKLRMVKNTLIKRALQNQDQDYSEIYPALKTSSTILFVQENGSEPAKLLKTFRGEGALPVLKGAYIDGATFLGDNQLEALSKLKSKYEMIGEVIGLLQSPAQNVLSALQSGGSTIAGLVKTLSEREG